LCARTQRELDESARLVRQAGGGRIDVMALRCDVANAESVAAFAAKVREELGAPRILVNNAGIVARGRLEEQDPAEWRAVVEVNLLGTYLVTREFLPAMRAARAGRVINLSSISGRLGTAQLTAYCTAKHGVVGLTRALAEEVRADNVQVNAICPGSVDTRMLEGSGYAPDMTPDDVARVALFLAAEAPAALTGACLDVFG
jgi:3-oxoacyl-[acyl-carrier protein] reductase